METKNLCPNCHNPIQKNASVCIYCQASLKTEPRSSRRSALLGCFLIPAILAVFAYFILFPKIKQVFVDEPDTTPSLQKQSPAPKRRAIQSSGDYNNEVTALDAYSNVIKAIQRLDEERARKYVTNKRWKEMELESGKPDAISELNAGCNVDTEFEPHDKNDRSVLIAQGISELVKDKGKPALKVLIIKMAKEEGQWKVFSLVCHHLPPANYMTEALQWLDEQPVEAQDLNSKLQAVGLKHGVQSCFIAIDEGNALALKRCLEVGWDPNTPGLNDRLAIDDAIRSIERGTPADQEILMALIKAGVDINSIGTNDMTPLMMSAKHCKIAIMKDLIRSKANLNIKNSEGISALGMSENCPEAKILLSHFVER
jgi:predicted nucleic acid-binding Zn ribbon protein